MASPTVRGPPVGSGAPLVCVRVLSTVAIASAAPSVYVADTRAEASPAARSQPHGSEAGSRASASLACPRMRAAILLSADSFEDFFERELGLTPDRYVDG